MARRTARAHEWPSAISWSTRVFRTVTMENSAATKNPLAHTSATRLAGLMALVCANGFFVAAEFSIVTVRKTRVDQLIAEGHLWARAVRRAITVPDRYIAATQVGITMASLGLGWIGEPSLAALLQPLLVFLPTTLVTTTAHTIAVAIAFTLITAVEIVLGELVPKWIALE